MITTHTSLGRYLPGLLAVLVLGFAPTAGQAQSVVFRNECQASIVVQISTNVQGNVMRAQPELLRAGDYSSKIKTDMDRIVTIIDAKSNRVLFRDALKATTLDLGFGIQPDPKFPNKVKLITRKVVNGAMEKGD